MEHYQHVCLNRDWAQDNLDRCHMMAHLMIALDDSTEAFMFALDFVSIMFDHVENK